MIRSSSCEYSHASSLRPGGATKALRMRRPSSLRIGMFCRSEEHTSELQSLMRISYAVFCLKKKTNYNTYKYQQHKRIRYTLAVMTKLLPSTIDIRVRNKLCEI